MDGRHVINRVKHPLKCRRVEVRRIETPTPRVRRIIVGGDELDGFVSTGFDDHVKLFFPDDSGALPEPIVGPDGVRFDGPGPKPAGRDFTPRRYDPARRELTIDFALHAEGPATAWASTAVPGSPLAVAGPRGSAVVSDTFDWYLLVGDETALPAIARRFEALRAGARVVAVIEVEDEQERQALPTRAEANVVWVHRRGGDGELAGDEGALLHAAASVVLPGGDGYAWVAGEAAMARRVRRHFIEDRGLDPAWIKAAAYWRIGGPGRHEVIAD